MSSFPTRHFNDWRNTMKCGIGMQIPPRPRGAYAEARSWGLQRKRARGGQHGRVSGGTDGAGDACLISGLLRDGRTRKRYHGKWVRV